LQSFFHQDAGPYDASILCCNPLVDTALFAYRTLALSAEKEAPASTALGFPHGRF
jgi:hypothetical protein